MRQILRAVLLIAGATASAVAEWNLMRVGDLIVLSSGGIGPTYLTALDLATGRAVWQTRGIKRSNGALLYARNRKRAVAIDIAER